MTGVFSNFFRVWVILITLFGTNAYAGHNMFRDNEPQNGRRLTRNVSKAAPQYMKKINSLAVQNKKAYGLLLYDDVETDKVNSFVSFNLPSVETFNKEILLGMYTSAGAYADGKYYFSATKVIGGDEVPGDFYTIDIATKRSTWIGSLSGYDYFINDMSYDYSTKTMYGVARLKNNNSALYKIDLKNYSSEKVAELDRHFFTLACSYGGQLYGVSRVGEFCKINKTTGAVEVIGDTGLKPTTIQSMEFDHTDKTLYWAAVLLSGESCIVTIDVKTGLAEIVGELGNGGEIAGLYIPFTASPDATPAAVSEMSVEPAEKGALEATLKWTNPTQTFGGGVLDQTFKIEIYRNDVLIETRVEPEPGAQETYIDKIAGMDGVLAKYKIVPVNSAGKGVAKESTIFVGKDTPAAPVNLRLVRNSYDKATISWEAPIIGNNGGWMDLNSLTYKVVRMPDNKVVAENLKVLICEDANITPATTYTYKVTAINSQGEGGYAETSPCVLGPKIILPYLGDFGKSDVVNSWTIINNNKDDRFWKNSYYASLKKNVMMYQFSSALSADDWLVSHAIPLVKEETYKVSFIINTMAANRLRFVLGKEAKVEALTEEVALYENIKHSNFTTVSFRFTAKETGDFNLGIQIFSPKNSSWVYISDVNIEQVVPNDLAAIALDGNVNPVVGNIYEYEFSIVNKGTQVQSNYTLNLKDALQDTILVSREIKEAIEPEAEKSFVLSWKATSENIKEMVGQLVLPNDDVLANDLTNRLTVQVHPKGSSETIDIKGTSSSNQHPFNFYETKSAAMNIYMPDEIKHSGGVIEKLVYSYNNGGKELIDTPIKVYMGNTERMNTLDGWISEDSLLLVYDGTCTIHLGEGKLEIPLDQYLVYEGKNLAVLTIQSMPSGYVYNLNFPCYVSKQEKNAALLWTGYSTPFDFSVTGRQGTTNSAMTFAMLCEGASISGKVSDVDIPLDSVKVTLKERKTTLLTDSEGNFVFDYVPDGTYTLLCSRHGYPDEEVANVVVANHQNVVRNIRMTNLPTYKLEGAVTDVNGQPMKDAIVELSGYENLTTTTSEDGKFVFPKVISAQEYKLVIQKEFYKPFTRSVEMLEAVNIGAVALDYFIYSPAGVYQEEKDGMISVKWDTPDKPISFIKDNGTSVGQTGITNGNGKVVMGVVHRIPTMVSQVSWFTTYEGGPHNIMHLFIYDLDEAGNPVNKVLYHVENIKNEDQKWNSYTLPEPIEAPNGFMIGLHYPGYIGIGVDSGKDIAYPFENRTYAFTANYENGQFDYLEGKGLNQNLMIRASGYVMADNMESAVKAAPLSAIADFWTYKVWRLASKDSETPEKWTLLTQSTISTTQYEDREINALLPGVYRYAVSTVYPDGKESKPMLSRSFAYNMITNATVKAKTNSPEAKAEGAVVMLTNEKGEVLTQTIDQHNQAKFVDLWKSKYKLTINLEGYEEVNKEVDFSLDNEYVTEEFLLKERIVKPKNLSTQKDGDHVKFIWNSSDNIFEDFEDIEDFTINPSGKLGWQYIDGDGAETYCFRNYRFPGEYNPKAYIVFNPSATIPAMENTEIQPYSGSKLLACFSADNYEGNDDYLISPELRFVGEFTFSFYAKSFSNADGYTDPFCIGYSKTGAEPEDFEWMAENVVPQVGSWKKYTYKIPADARYVTIHCVSTNGFVLMIDDIFIGQEQRSKIKAASSVVPEFIYEVYLDGKKVAETTNCSYMFQNISAGRHTAGVRSVYYSGASEMATCEFETGSGISSDIMQPLRVYPNPARESVMVEGEYASLELYDVSGYLVANYEGLQERIDLSTLAEGFYILVAYDENHHCSAVVKFRIIK